MDEQEFTAWAAGCERRLLRSAYLLTGDLQRAPATVAPALPDVIDPPTTSPALADRPIEAAVLAVEQDGVAQVLSTRGEWRSVPLSTSYPVLELSPLGTRLVVSSSSYGSDGVVTVVDLATGASSRLDLPDGFVEVDNTTWRFVDEDTLFVQGGNSFEVDATTGSATPVDHGADAFGADGAALEVDCCIGPRELTDWAGGAAREVSLRRTGRLSSVHASADSVVGTSYDGRPFAVVLADRATLSPQSVLPVRDREGACSNGGLSVLSIADDDTVLLRVHVVGKTGDGFRVVAWDPASSALSLVSTNPVTRQVAFADGLLRASGR